MIPHALVRRSVVALLALVVVAVGCGGDDDAGSTTTTDPTAPTAPAADEADPLAGRTFTGGRIEVDDDPVDVPDGGTLTVEFTGSGTPGNGTVRAAAGCADLSAGYTIVPEGLMTNGFITNEVDCDEAAAEFDELIDELLRSPAYQLEDDTLTLLVENDERQLRAVLADEG